MPRSCASPRRFFRVTLAVARGRGSPPDGSSGHDGRFARSSPRALRGAFNETQVKDASERWRHAVRRFLAHLPREHSTIARARAQRASRATEGVQAKGAPSRGGPVRAEVAAALRAPGSLESIATLVSSPNRDASRRACHALDALLHLLSSATSARPCASSPSPSPTAPPAPTPFSDAALAAASAASALNLAARRRRRCRRASRRRRRRRRRRTPRAIRARKSHRLHRLPRRPRRRRLGAPRGTLPPVV